MAKVPAKRVLAQSKSPLPFLGTVQTSTTTCWRALSRKGAFRVNASAVNDLLVVPADLLTTGEQSLRRSHFDGVIFNQRVK